MSIAYLLDQIDGVYRLMTTSSDPNGSVKTGLVEDLRLPTAVLRELARMLRTVRFGTVELVIHDGRVVQLERREKIRVTQDVTQHEA
jgi:hypothetical protein